MPNIQFQFRRGLAAQWASVNPVLAEGEMGIETDTDLFKIGDGTTTWNSLPYGGLQGIQGVQGTQGVQGLQGIQGETGIQGSQGVQGTQGVQGLQGAQGLDGIQGVQGTQGIQGDQGIQGVQGEIGIQGVQGTQGIQGLDGIQGLQGIQGEQGLQGVQGEQGIQGTQGVQGRDGTFGGASFYYQFLTKTDSNDPNAGNLNVDNSNLSLATLLTIDDLDRFGANISNFLQTIDDSTSGIKGTVKLSEEANTLNFVVYNIPSTHTEHQSHFDIPIAYILGTSTPYSNGTNVVISFLVTGDKGDQGLQGIQGIQGTQGIQGLQGIQGDFGPQGLQGIQGVSTFPVSANSGTDVVSNRINFVNTATVTVDVTNSGGNANIALTVIGGGTNSFSELSVSNTANINLANVGLLTAYDIRIDGNSSYYILNGNAAFNNMAVKGNVSFLGDVTNDSDTITVRSSAPVDGDGYFRVKRGTKGNAEIRFLATSDVWQVTPNSNATPSTYLTILTSGNIVNSVISTSVNDVASAGILKFTYDLANTANTNANSAHNSANNSANLANTKVAKSGDTMTGNLIVSGTSTINVSLANISTISSNTLTLATATSSNGNVIITANGVEYIRVVNTGNVGIFTTNPTSNLHVVGNANITTGINTATLNATTINVATMLTRGGINVALQASDSYAQANAAYGQANSARDQANTAYGQANAARDQANTGYGQANLAYAAANSAANTVRVSQNSGSTLSAKQLNFVNTANVTITVTDSGDGNANVAIFSAAGGGGGGSAITVKDENSTLTTALASLDFVGAGVTATTVGNDVTVTISGGTGSQGVQGVQGITGSAGSGGSPSTFVTTNANYTMSSTDDAVVSNATSAITVTLPNASTVKSYYFQNMGSNTMTLATVSSQLINDDTTLILQFNGSSCRLISNGSAFLLF